MYAVGSKSVQAPAIAAVVERLLEGKAEVTISNDVSGWEGGCCGVDDRVVFSCEARMKWRL